MNNTAEEATALVSEILQLLSDKPIGNRKVIFFPPYVYLQSVSAKLQTEGSKSRGIYAGGQNCHWEEKGAYTGEISASMLKSAGARYVIIGHSERRQYFHETNELLARKIKVAFANGLIPVYCCGESLADRKSGRHFEMVKKQMEEGLFSLPSFPGEIILAYEPVWAIGTGETATPQQAQEMHAFIRSIISDKYGREISASLPLLYGGSCNASNAPGLFSQPDIDGGLIGGASLKAREFVSIIHSF